ncbi:MAG: FmdB family zinc ribbon protein, partial [Steroidobacteraceae bacterium]
MPFYEYECQSCKFYTEVMQKISEPPLAKCPSCGKKALQKLVSAPVFRLKGAGWYETDFKSDGENKRNLAGGDKEESKTPEASSTPTSDGKSDSKPATAAETKTAPASAEPKRESVDSSRRSSTRSVAAQSERKGQKRSPSKP